MMETQHGASLAGSKVEPVKRKVMRTPDGRELPAGRVKGVPNKLTVTLKAAVERAARDCHPEGLAGWLVERANGSIGDRQIFAAMVGKVIPIQVNQSVEGGISINLNWLGGRAIGTVAAQPQVRNAEVIDLIEDSGGTNRIVDQHTQQAAPAGAPAGTAQKASGARDEAGT